MPRDLVALDRLFSENHRASPLMVIRLDNHSSSDDLLKGFDAELRREIAIERQHDRQMPNVFGPARRYRW